MNKKIIMMAVMVTLTLSSFAQGIKFEHGTFVEALAKAKAENKLLFVDFYTSWCGPCKKMSKTIFPQEEVGTFFNKNFVSLKIDAEKGEGPEIAKKFEVKSYPTMVFINTDGTEAKRMVGAAPDGSFLIDFAKQVTGEKISFLDQYEQYKRGKRDLGFIRDLILSGGIYISTIENQKEQMEWFAKMQEMANWYFAVMKPQDMMNKDDFRLISMYLDGPNNGNPFVEHIYNNYESWAEIIPNADLSLFIFRTNNQSIHEAYRKGNLKYREYLAAIHGRLAKVYADTPGADADNSYKVMTCVAESGYCLYSQKDVDGYLDWNAKYSAYQKEKGELDDRSYMAFVGNCLRASKEYITDKQVKRLMGELKNGLKLNAKNPTLHELMGDCYAKLGQKDKAIAQYNKMIEVSKDDERAGSWYKETATRKINELK
jgi:thiol-disulfide isomerase/thioredoxin